MAEGIKDKVEEAGKKVAEKAAKVGHKIAEGYEEVADKAKEKMHAAGHRAEEATQKARNAAQEACGTAKTTADIHERMNVIASCGKRVGIVDHIEGKSIKLTKNDSTAGGTHHLIPMDWVATVDKHIHLNKNSEEVFREWKAEPAVTAV